MLLPRRRPPRAAACRWWCCEQTRPFVDARVKWVRDRALDHAVEKEKYLFPFHNLKDLLLLSSSSSSSSSPSLPLSSISSHRSDLLLPFRPIRFIRLFPSAFLEDFLDGGAAPHISPTPGLIRLHEDEERALIDSRSDAADRLLRLLMLTPRRRLPLRLIDRLRWDLGLPRDYPSSLLPDFPDYFQLVPSATTASNDVDLELVWYSKDLAVSAMERIAAKTGYKKGMPLRICLQYPRGLVLEKKVKTWVEEWQKLPYISPYEDGSRLAQKSDIAEKWTVGVLHELLHLLIGKKTEKDNLILLCEHVGLRPGFRKVIVNHPGIFYISNKLQTETVVLREAYHRDRLLENHPLMGLRYQYIHLMHKGKETGSTKKDKKSKRATPGSKEHSKDEDQVVEDDDDYEDEDEDDDDEELTDNSETEDEESDDEYEDINAAKGTALPHVPGTCRPIKVKEDMQRRSSSHKMSSTENHLRTSKTNVGKKSHLKANYPRADQRPSFRRKVSI